MKRPECILALLACLFSVTSPSAAACGDSSDSLIIIACAVSAGPAASEAGTHRNGVTIAGLPLVCYQKFISSQDGSTCTFKQNCSGFGAWAVRTHGIVEGSLLTADRITRCNGIKPGRYQIDSATGRNIDDIPGLLK